MMFLANENFPRPSILLLRANGYVIESIQEKHQGISDEKVLQIAQENKLIILTFDKDYGELIFRYASHNPPSVIFFRGKGGNPLYAGQILLSFLSENNISFSNSFSVVDDKSIRQRFYTK